MDEEKRIEVIKEMKSMSALGVIACGIGLPIYFTGSVFALGIRGLQLLGIGLISFGWFWTWGLCLVKGKVTVSKSIAMIAVGILWIIFYSY
ncbi:hypothetical protein [Sporosarcina sp. NPDC096371]|uniref:hypothetical protein n=1 Tax=Sporosarcina sp. NPDC096371 TaxID=3364530 RepID=UPI0038102FE4